MTREEAIKAIKAWDFLNNDEKEVIETLIPELVESDDERIRKRIIHALHGDVLDMEETNKAIAWLEKQGEQKPEKKELKTIDWSKHIKYEPNSPSIIEQKPTWSEDDEEMCQETIDWFEKKCFPYALESENPARESINWLKSLKDRVHPQSQWKPSDEQMEALHDMNLTGNISYAGQGQTLIELYNDLKKLKEEQV